MVLGVLPDAMIGRVLYKHLSLGPFLPFTTLLAALTGYLVVRSSRDRRAAWAWIPGLIWFGFGVHDMLFVKGVLQIGSWAGSTPLKFLLDNLLTSKCSDTECFDELVYTAPLISSIVYSIASGVTLKLIQRGPLPTKQLSTSR